MKQLPTASVPLLGDRLCAHPWPPARAEDLQELWFADELEEIQAAVASFGEAHGVTVCLEFVDGGYKVPSTSFALSVLTVDNLAVPYDVIGLGEQQPLPTARELVKLYNVEVARLLAAGSKLEDRYREMRTEALRSLKELPPSCGLSSLIHRPIVLGREDPTNSTRAIAIGIKILDSSLKHDLAILHVSASEEMASEFGRLKLCQEIAFEQQQRLRKNPNEILMDRFAAFLLAKTGVRPDEVIRLAGERVCKVKRLTVNDAVLTDVSFALCFGRITASFEFEEGELRGSWLSIYEEIAESVKSSLVGKSTKLLISGGIFDEVSATIAGFEDSADGVLFELEEDDVAVPLAKPWIV